MTNRERYTVYVANRRWEREFRPMKLYEPSPGVYLARAMLH